MRQRERESMEFDVVIVGAGPSGLATACRIRQLCLEQNLDLSVCLIEKASEIGAHILSGAIIEPGALTELFPNWQELGAPLSNKVNHEEFHFLLNESRSFKVPQALLPKSILNHGNYIASLGNLCRWLCEQAEQLGVEIFTGFAASEVLYDDEGMVRGVATGDMGVSQSGEHKDSYEPGYELLAGYTVFAEGCRGHLGKELISRFRLDQNKTPQHYALGIKELWQVLPEHCQMGKVEHGLGWPLGFGNTTGGWFLYHLEDSQVVIGLIVDLNYQNPWLSPFDEFQRLKHHPRFKKLLNGGKRLSYGARALVKGGLQALPNLVFPGGLLVGDEAGFLNFAKIKGSHTAIKSGLIAAESIVSELKEKNDNASHILESYQHGVDDSWLKAELYSARNCAPGFHKFGTFFGSLYNFIDQKITRGNLPITLHDRKSDHSCLAPAKSKQKIIYQKADNMISFDIMSSVYLSNTHHEEDQPCHLVLTNPEIPLTSNLSTYAEPAVRYCPAGVYEIIELENKPKFQINPQNCLHCKTCDIKDPAQNITWLAPEGSGGPNYPNM